MYFDEKLKKIALIIPCIIASYTRNKKLSIMYCLLYLFYGFSHKRKLINDPTSESIKPVDDVMNSIMSMVLFNGILNALFIIFKARYPLIWGRGYLKRIIPKRFIKAKAK